MIIARILTFYYFAYFLIVLPLLSRIETPRATSNSIADDVLGKKALASVAAALIAGWAAVRWRGQRPRGRRGAVRTRQRSRRVKSGHLQVPSASTTAAQLQRGFKVYKEVCSTCHGLSFLAFRNLAEPGGPGFTPAQAGAVAADYKIKDGPNDQGEMFERPGRAADRFPSPFPNEQAARLANGGALPPDLSLITKARTYERGFPWFIFDIFSQYQEQGPDYIVALLNGYEEAPHGFTLPPGANYNKFFPSNAIGHAEATERWPGDLRGRLAADCSPVRQGRDRVPDVGRRTAHGNAQAYRLPGLHLPHFCCRACCISRRRKSGLRRTDACAGAVISERPLGGLFCWVRHSGSACCTQTGVSID